MKGRGDSPKKTLRDRSLERVRSMIAVIDRLKTQGMIEFQSCRNSIVNSGYSGLNWVQRPDFASIQRLRAG
jgi:hypothetical protein